MLSNTFTWRVKDHSLYAVNYNLIINKIAKKTQNVEKTTEEIAIEIADAGVVIPSFRYGIEIHPPRVDILRLIVDLAEKNGFKASSTSPSTCPMLYDGYLRLFNLKRGVRITFGNGKLSFYIRKGKKYVQEKCFYPNDVINDDDTLNDSIIHSIENAQGSKLNRNDLVQNLVAMEVRDLIDFTDAKCSLYKARDDNEAAKLSFKGSHKTLIGNVDFDFYDGQHHDFYDGQHHGTFCIFINIDGTIRVVSQMGNNYTINITPENPLFTPENIATWMKRCAEADMREAKVLLELKSLQKKHREALKSLENHNDSH